MKFSIVEKLDIKKLNKSFYEYRDNINNDPYIFINEETVKELERISCEWSPFEDDQYIKHNPKTHICTYQGCKVFIDPTLRFGEVEFR